MTTTQGLPLEEVARYQRDSEEPVAAPDCSECGDFAGPDCEGISWLLDGLPVCGGCANRDMDRGRRLDQRDGDSSW